MSTFLKDKKISEMYEAHFAEMLGGKHNLTNVDDHGVDIILGDAKIDVKAFRCPPFVGEYDGIFLEVRQKSGKDGWYVDDTKETTHYLFLKDCNTKHIEYSKGWFISKKHLQEAVRIAILRMDFPLVKGKFTDGRILPYEYLDAFAERIFIGGEENGKTK